MQSTKDSLLRVAPLTKLQAKGIIVVKGDGHTIAVVAHDGNVSAVDNRCPHMGFPLHKGTVQDGILTCHWHHARFDLCSGCTFDLFADDVPAYDTEVRDGIVYVTTHPRRGNRREYYMRRLQDGMQQGISLIQAKCLIGLMHSGVDHRDIVRQVALFGVHNRDDWASGMTSLAALANLASRLKEETAYLALYQGTRRVAGDAAGQAPRRQRQALETRDHSLDTLKRWLRYWTLVRQRDGAERTLLTAVENGATPEQLADLLFTAITDRFYAATGHLLDFSNKAFELLDLIGWQHAREVLPSIVAQLVSSRGGEESNSWRHPVDLIPPLQQVGKEIVGLFEQGKGKRWSGERELSSQLLGEDPLKIIEALKDAIRSGAQPQQLSKSLAYAAAMRVVHFGTANEFGDWITALHTFTYSNALHQAIQRCPSPEIVRGVFHGAISVYLDRFLNVPPAKLPGDGSTIEAEPREPEKLLQRFLDLLDQRHEVDAAARIVVRYLRLGHPVEALFDTFTRAAVQEDADFHTFQMVEAGIRQYEVWKGQPEAEHILIAVARYLAAHSPTMRSQLQTATVALRLHKGESLYEEES